MRPVSCTHALDESGDCWRACVATILGLSAPEVPHFVHLDEQGGGDWIDLTRTWLNGRCLGLVVRHCNSSDWSLDDVLLYWSAENPGTPIIVSGEAGDDPSDNHAVVVLNGRIAHDPSGIGLAGPMVNNEKDADRFWRISIITLGADR